MDFTLNTIMGDRGVRDYANLVVRSCLFVSRANSKWLSHSSPTEEKQSTRKEQVKGEWQTCVVSFDNGTTKKPGSKVLAKGCAFSNHRDSVLVYKENKEMMKKKLCDDDDDETASTVDMEEDELMVSGSSPRKNRSRSERQRRVHFTDELVTAVYTRPRTTKEDKYYLHYDEYDYMDFKLEYRDSLLQEQREKGRQTSSRHAGDLQQQRATNYRRSPRKVTFKREVVTSVHPVMDRNARNKIMGDLFYTEEEMRTFLDEFVASLQKQSRQKQSIQHQQHRSQVLSV